MDVGSNPHAVPAVNNHSTPHQRRGRHVQTMASTRLSRRNLFKAAAAVAAALGVPAPALAHGHQHGPQAQGRRLRRPGPGQRPHPHHGRPQFGGQRGAHPRRPLRRVGRDADSGHDARVIDLRGRTVVPGLIESHTHFVSLANRPGYHVAQWELASNVAEVLAALARAAARRRAGGAVHHRDGRGRAEHLARAPHAHARRARCRRARPAGVPVPGRRRAGARQHARQGVLRDRDKPLPACTVNADGTIPGGNPNQANAALYHLRIRQTFEDKKRSCSTRRHSPRASASPRCSTRRWSPSARHARSGPLDPQPNHGARPRSTTTACTTRGSRCTPRATA